MNKDDSLVEFNLTNILNMLMWVLFGLIIYMLFKNGTELKPELFIAISALTASVAMTRSVYASKVSDKIKADTELMATRLELYSEAQKLAIRIGDNDFSKTDLENIIILVSKVRIFFNPDKDLVESIKAIAQAGTKLTKLNANNSYEEFARVEAEKEKIKSSVGNIIKVFNNLFSNFLPL